jgi:hypothetical protein
LKNRGKFSLVFLKRFEKSGKNLKPNQNQIKALVFLSNLKNRGKISLVFLRRFEKSGKNFKAKQIKSKR